MQQTEAIPPTGISLWISNRDRINIGEEPFDFFLPPLDTLTNTNTQTYTLLVKQVLIRNFFDNVIENNSDILEVIINNDSYVNIFESGHYSAETLQESIQSFFNTINPNLTITYDLDEKRYSITIPSGISFQFVSPNLNILQPYRYRRSHRFLELIGFQDLLQVNKSFVGPTIIVGKNPVNLYGTSFVDINLQSTSLPSMNTSGSLKTLIRIPILSQYGQLEAFEPGVPVTAIIESSSLDNLRILITNEWGEKLQGPNDSLFSMSLLLVANDF